MQRKRRGAPGLKYLPLCAIAIAATWQCRAGTLDVQVVDTEGHPIAGAAVYAVASKPLPPPPSAAPTAIMDQQHNTFVPHVLIVRTGTLVDFPNNDVVSHHVYSFSEAKTFELGLYKGDAHPPILFDKPGIVVLGCNIHDSMLGYILVVDTPYFARTGQSGHAELADLPSDRYTVHVWTPRARPKNLPDSVIADVGPETKTIAFRIDGKLLPAHDHGDTSLTWERY